MSRVQRIGSAVALLVTLGALLPTAAAAGEYNVRQCLTASQRGFEGVASALGGTNLVSFTEGCYPGGSGLAGVYQDRTGPNLSDRSGGQFGWEAPAGAPVVATRFDLRMKDANGIVATPLGPGADFDGGELHDGTRVVSRWTDRSNPQPRVAARLVCRRASGCENLPASTRALIEVFDAEFTLRDAGPPELTPGGSVWDWGSDAGWHQGSGSLTIAATDDGGGIFRAWAEINGIERSVGLVLCGGVTGGYAISMKPCSGTVNVSGFFDTRATPFREGDNWVRLCAEDFSTYGSSNRSCSERRSVLVDNQPPAAAIGLHPVGGSGWRAENGFEFAWESPGEQTSPLAGGEYRLLDRASGEAVSFGQVPAGETAGPVTAPAPGEYEFELRLLDAAGNLGPPAVTTIRFDDRPPGDVAPEAPSGWISADELPLRQPVERAEPGGPSGIAGYALALDSGAPVAPCPSGRCLMPQFALTGGADDRVASIPGLGEGSHWISAVGFSGAAVGSVHPGSTMVRVDRTAPRVSLRGAPSGWSNRPVTVSATASDGLSGMEPAPDDNGEPETVIQAEGFSPYRVPGAGASFTVTAEGASLVRYWARDLAGNSGDGNRGPDGTVHSEPGEALVRIDTEPPVLRFIRERDPDDPERIELLADDPASGPSGAEISYRQAGSGVPFTALPTRSGGDGRFIARIPSDDLKPGTWELSARGSDQAGNTASGDRATDGEPMLLNLPLKRRTVLRAGFDPHGTIRKTVPPGRAVRISGRLSDGGRGLSGARLAVTELFDRGSRPARRESSVRTDGTGRFSLRLRPGPGRRVKLLYPGSLTRSRASGRVIRLQSRGRVSLSLRPRTLRNGNVVRMKGRVTAPGALMPARGKLIAIQYFDPARSRWRPVELIRSRPGGTFSFRYRFRTIASAQRIIFRAAAPAEAGWPYMHSTSPPRSVIVVPR